MQEPKIDMEQLLDHVLNDKPISIARMHEWLKHLVGERVAHMQEIEKHKAFYDYMLGLYGEGLEIANWHLNGETEPYDNFFDSAREGMQMLELIQCIGGEHA